jgi:hypothetical protein
MTESYEWSLIETLELGFRVLGSGKAVATLCSADLRVVGRR